MNDNTVFIDGIRVTQEEALQLMTHYLIMAAHLYEAIPDDNEKNAVYMQSKMNDYTFDASIDFYNSLGNAYSRYDDGE